MPKAANPATQGVVSVALADTDNISAPLVSYLKRLRDLDETSEALSISIKRTVDARLRETRGGGDGEGGGSNSDPRESALENQKVAEETKRSLAVCDEKVALAQRCYDLVEQHIARLDKDLRVFDQALAEKEAAAALAKGLVPPPTAASVGGNGLASPEKPRPAIGDDFGSTPAEADEPKYCVCNRVSFGEMIACENETCAVEWFHFACVGLSTDAKIKGKWFCNACAAEKRRLKKLEAKLTQDAKREKK